ncbi:hypothetical protein PHYSODRAFT_461507, partial [Phytophthora sojae]
MDLLEEFMPGMGDVLAAQENALTSVVATLTSQLQLLAAANERQTQKITQLESTQLTMRLAPSPPDSSVVDALATLSTRMEQLQQNVQQQVAEQMQQALINVLRSEATNSLAEKAKQTEEAVKMQLEQLEKRFDYLSR